MIIDAVKDGPVKNWKYLLRCEICSSERWVGPGGSPEKRQHHHCQACRSKQNWSTACREKRKRTCIEKYGHENPFQSEKTQKTLLERYGVGNVFQAEVVKEKSKKTLLQNHGVRHPLQSAIIREKFSQTMIEKFGVPHALQSAEIKSKMDFTAAWVKQHESAKKNGLYGCRTSIVENDFFEELVRLFGTVERQVIVNERSIDFYVSSIDAYIQLDGVYWHGLTKTAEELQASCKKRDKQILVMIQRDEAQNKWFAENNLLLIRITDLEFRKGLHLDKLKSYFGN
jgi:hypothetical protein